MNWRLIRSPARLDLPGDEFADHLVSDDPAGFTINKAAVAGRLCLVAVHKVDRLATILHVERELDPTDEPARLAAQRRCVAACEARALQG